MPSHLSICPRHQEVVLDLPRSPSFPVASHVVFGARDVEEDDGLRKSSLTIMFSLDGAHVSLQSDRSPMHRGVPVDTVRALCSCLLPGAPVQTICGRRVFAIVDDRCWNASMRCRTNVVGRGMQTRELSVWIEVEKAGRRHCRRVDCSPLALCSALPPRTSPSGEWNSLTPRQERRPHPGPRPAARRGNDG